MTEITEALNADTKPRHDGRHIWIEHPEYTKGERVQRAGWIRSVYEDPDSVFYGNRSAIADALTEMEGKFVPYQIVFAATRDNKGPAKAFKASKAVMKERAVEKALESDNTKAQREDTMVRADSGVGYENPQITALEGRVDKVEDRLMSVESRLIVVETKIDAIDERITVLDKKIDGVETSLNARIDRFETSINARIDSVETSINARMDRIEDKMLTKWDMAQVMLLLMLAMVAISGVVIRMTVVPTP